MKSIFTKRSLSGAQLTGTPPSSGESMVPCQDGNDGAGELACDERTIGQRVVHTYVEKPNGPPMWEMVPVGERFAGLYSFSHHYAVIGEARNSKTQALEARLRYDVAIRSIPLFQFAAFFANDIDIFNGPEMILRGPVHTNKNLYLSTVNGLNFEGQVSAGGSIFRGVKFEDNCTFRNGAVKVKRLDGTMASLPDCQEPRYELTESDIAPWQGQIRMNVGPVEVPTTDTLDVGGDFWTAADLRLVLKLNKSGADTGLPDTSGDRRLAIEVQDVNGGPREDATDLLEECSGTVTSLFVRNPAPAGPVYDVSTGGATPGLIFGNDANTSNKAVGVSNTFFDVRENQGGGVMDLSLPPYQSSTLLEIDARALLDCVQRGLDSDGDGVPGPDPVFLLDNFRSLDDDTDGGLVVYVTVDGPRSDLQQSFYGVRIRNGQILKSQWPGSPAINGLSFVSNYMLYSLGSYNAPVNASDWRPAAFMADAYTALSGYWCEDSKISVPATWGPYDCDRKSVTDNGWNIDIRRPSSSGVLNTQVAILAGHDDNEDTKISSGGLHNFMRYMEDLNDGVTHNYSGSLVSLGTPKHCQGQFIDPARYDLYSFNVYHPPFRNYLFDNRFTVRTNLPPATPEMSFATQKMFNRTFEQ